MRKVLLTGLVLAMATALALAGPLRAEEQTAAEMKPVVLVKLASYQATFDNVARVGEMMDNPHLAHGLEALLKLVTQNRGVQGIDTARPGGAVIETDGEHERGYVFVPVTDLKEVLVTVEPFIGKPKESDGVYQFDLPRRSIYFTQKDGWAFFTQEREVLDRVPENPLELLGGLTDEYDSAIRFLPQNAPEKHRRRLVERMQEAAQRYVEREHEGESEEIATIRKGTTLRLVAIARALIRDTESVTIGSKMTETGEVFVELTGVARPGSEVAGELNKCQMSDSKFAGIVLPGAAVSAVWGATLPDVASDDEWSACFDLLKIEAFRKIEGEGKSLAVTSASKDFVAGLLAVTRDTITEGRLEGAMSVVLEPDRAVYLSGKNVSSGDDVERALGRLVDAARAENPGFVDQVLQTDVAEVNGVRMHRVVLPITEQTPDREKMLRLFGETLDIVVGIADRAVYLAVGRGALDVLKEAVSKKETCEIPPLTVTVSVREVSEFTAEHGSEHDRARAAKAAQILQDSEAEDNVTLRELPVENGVRYRLSVDPGVVQLFFRGAELR